MDARTGTLGSTHMAELTINADEIAAALRKHVGTFTPALAKDQVGRILEVGDGIARVSRVSPTPRSTSCSSSRAARSASR